MIWIAAEMRAFASSPAALSGSCPGTPGNAEASAATMASAAAWNTAGFIDVSRPRRTASADAPACPLLKCNPTDQWREASKSTVARRFTLASSKRDAGIQRDVYAYQYADTWSPSPAHHQRGSRDGLDGSSFTIAPGTF